MSKRYCPINYLPPIGPVLGCNLGFLDHPCEYLAFRDKEIRTRCLSLFDGIKIMPQYGITDAHYSSDELDLIESGADKIYFYDWLRVRQQNGPAPRGGWDLLEPWPNPDKMIRGTQGYLMIQLAFHMGCTRVVLIGFDCCILPGEKNSHVHRPDSIKSSTKDVYYDYEHKGKKNKVTDHYLRFKEDDEQLIGWIQGKGADVYKLGDYGILDIPVVRWQDVMKWTK